MEKQRKYKMLTITALVFAIAALTLGFASFSKIMKISSSATVSIPKEEDFALTLYGAITEEETGKIYSGNPLDFSLWSTEKAYALDYLNSKFIPDYYATIDNNNLTIDINKLVLNAPEEYYVYFVVLKNESDYGVYISLSDESRSSYKSSEEWAAICTADNSTTETLVNKACNNIFLRIGEVRESDGSNVLSKFLNGNYKLPAGKYAAFSFIVGYTGSERADGSFTVNFDPIKIEFNTVPHVYPESYALEEDA